MSIDSFEPRFSAIHLVEIREGSGRYPRLNNPAHPDEVQVSRSSDALTTRALTQGAFTNLFLGLGAVALLVGAVGIGNVMVISVLERRSDVRLRRALGAKRVHIGGAVPGRVRIRLCTGGIAGAALGTAATVAYATNQSLTLAIPPAAIGGGIALAIGIGAMAGIYHAMRAARLSPTAPLRSV